MTRKMSTLWMTAGPLLLAAVAAPLTGEGPTGPDAPAPKTVAEGLARLEKCLGVYREDDQHEWRVPTEFESRQRPDPSQPEILTVFAGLKVVGRPFQGQGSIHFDEVWQWQRQVYDLGEGGKKALTRTQESHNVTRYTLSIKEGAWFVTGTMLSNGVHDSIGKPTFQGAVKWHPDGFEFVGYEGPGRYYASGGKFILGCGHGAMRYARDGDRLVMKWHLQPCHLAATPDGSVLPSPDLKRPFGSPFTLEFKSDPARHE